MLAWEERQEIVPVVQYSQAGLLAGQLVHDVHRAPHTAHPGRACSRQRRRAPQSACDVGLRGQAWIAQHPYEHLHDL